jgi:hypothetical protein
MKFSDVSPLAGMLTGEGAMGKLIGKGFGGALPAAIARSAQRDAAEEERQKAIAASAQGQPMKKGGKAKGYAKGGVTRADGCITKGHTNGKMV